MSARVIVACPDCAEEMDEATGEHTLSGHVECHTCADCDAPMHREPNGAGGTEWVHPDGSSMCDAVDEPEPRFAPLMSTTHYEDPEYGDRDGLELLAELEKAIFDWTRHHESTPRDVVPKQWTGSALCILRNLTETIDRKRAEFSE